MLALSLTYIGLSYNRLAQDRGRLRTREADLQVRENIKEEEKITANNFHLETYFEYVAGANMDGTQESEKKLRAEVERLSRQLNDSEGNVSQAQYDMNSQQQELDRLRAENVELVEAADELDRQVKELTGKVTSLTAQVNALDISNEALSEKASFMDRYVVFVNNDSSKLYHSYSCKTFTRQNFWAYSRKLAENNGFSPCPDCQRKE